MNKSNLKLYNEFYNLYIYLYPILKRFPRSEKFSLRQEIDKTLLEIILIFDRFVKIKQSNRSSQLRKASYLFDRFKLLIRISFDLGFIKQTHFILLMERYEVIGRMLGGLIKSETNN